MKTARLALSTAVAVTALIGLPSVAAAQTPIVGGSTSAPGPVLTAPAPTSQGIIMRDGGICDPIRHMGC